MKYRIHFEHADGTRDSMLISGSTIEDVQKKTYAELEKRNSKGLWSDKIS